jgi:hypothetical protein
VLLERNLCSVIRKSTVKCYQKGTFEELPRRNMCSVKKGTCAIYIKFELCLSVCLSRFCYRGNTPQYLSQMKSELHETFRISSWGSTKMIQHVKDDPILQVSSQDPSASSKYDFEDRGVLEALLNMLES